MPISHDTIFLTRGDIAQLMQPGDYLDAIQAAFIASTRGQIESPPPLHLQGMGGGIHAKGAVMKRERAYAAIKLNANFPGNPAHGLPTIQGIVALFDAESGAVLALMDSIEITLRRTAAATALAARHLARGENVSVTICGCGEQAAPQLEALAQVCAIAQAYAFDIDSAKSQSLAGKVLSLRFPVEPVRDLHTGTRASDIIITCTTACTPFLDADGVSPGAFIAAVGADNPEKSEIAPALMAAAHVVVDSLDQCTIMGDLHHAIAAGAMDSAEVYASLADVLSGSVPTRPDPTDIIIFDSTGTALQDVAAAACVYERALSTGAGEQLKLA